MAPPAPKHFNPSAGSPPYKSLFSNVSIAPANSSIAYISTQWAADPSTGELAEGTAGDFGKQSKIIWGNIAGILKELGVTMREVVHTTVLFTEFSDEIGKAVVEAQMSALPEEWHQYALKPSLSFLGVGHMHRPGMVYAVDIVVAVPPHHG